VAVDAVLGGSGLTLNSRRLIGGFRVAAILALPGLANLVSMKDGEVVLAFDGLRYGRHEVVPTALLNAADCPAPPCTAGAYVAHCMTQKFGRDRQGWPPLAQEFLSGETPPQRS
jgi:hypothetical protein